MPRAASLGLTVVSGMSYGVCFPTRSVQLLAWVALVPWLVALRRSTTAWTLVLGWVWTLTAAYTLGDWFPHSIASYYRQPLWVGAALFLGVTSVMAAPYYVAFALWVRAGAAGTRWYAPFLVAAAWVAGELARARLVGGNPWALFGYSQIGRDALVQIADVTSVYGVSFALVAVNAALATVVGDRRPTRRAVVLGLAAAVACALALPFYGRWRLATLPAATAPSVAVGLVQGNLDVGTQWSEELYGQNLDVYLQLTADLARTARPALFVWPENALTFFLESEPAYRAAIARVLAASDAELLAGGPRTVASAEGPRYYNSMFLLGADGAIRGRYDKQHLVPLGERFPFPWLASLARRYERVRELSPGPARDPMPTTAGAAGITICSEAMFPEIAAERVRAGATFFVDPAHDTWLTPKFSAQQFDVVRLRSVEQRRWLARASTSGPSAVVDPFGRVVVRSDCFARTALVGRIVPRDDVTPYPRIGDAFAGLCALAAGAAWMTRRS